MSRPTRLTVGPKLHLPLDIATRRLALVGSSGSGKSNAAVVIAEEMHRAGIPWAAIDPKGDWWGIRSDEAGTGQGLPVPVLGGLHGDFPLDASAGKVVGRMLAERRITCVLDVSEFDTNQDRYRFLADLAEAFLAHNTQPYHLFLEEADEYLPQRLVEKGNLPRCLGNWSRLVRRGRQRGIGCTLNTQRCALVSKDVLYQAEAFVALRTPAKRDRDTVRDWVVQHDLGPELADSLPSLEDGEAWVISPQWLHQTVKGRFRRRRTFDSGATPVIGTDAAPAELAVVDLEALTAELAETVERAAADDPVKLRARIRELEGEAKVLKDALEVEVGRERDVERVEVPVEVAVPFVPPELRSLMLEAADAVEEGLDRLGTGREKLLAAVEASKAEPRAVPALAAGPSPEATEPRRVGSVRDMTERLRELPPAVAAAGGFLPGPPPASQGGLKAGARRLLDAIVALPGCTAAQAATTARLSRKGGTFGTYAGHLVAGGLVTNQGGYKAGRFWPTDAGKAASGTSELPTEPEAILAHWRGTLKAGARRMLDELVAADHRGLTREDLAARAHITSSGGTFGTYLGHLRTAGLLEDPEGDRVRLVEHLLKF